MAERYDSNERKARRLGSTVCKYDGVPVYVMNGLHIRGKQQTTEEEVYIAPLSKSKDVYNEEGWKLVKYTDDRFSYKSSELGYMNYKEQAVYVQRTPVRGQYQGLNGQNIRNSGGFDNWSILQTEEMEACIKGEYPPFDTALGRVHDGHKSCAFSRDMAIMNRGRGRVVLLFKDREIGVLSARLDMFRIHEARDNKFICNILDEHKVKHVIDSDA